MSLNVDFVNLERRETWILENQRDQFTRNMDHVATRVIEEISEFAAINLCWHSHTYLASISQPILGKKHSEKVIEIMGKKI